MPCDAPGGPSSDARTRVCRPLARGSPAENWRVRVAPRPHRRAPVLRNAPVVNQVTIDTGGHAQTLNLQPRENAFSTSPRGFSAPRQIAGAKPSISSRAITTAVAGVLLSALILGLVLRSWSVQGLRAKDQGLNHAWGLSATVACARGACGSPVISADAGEDERILNSSNGRLPSAWRPDAEHAHRRTTPAADDAGASSSITIPINPNICSGRVGSLRELHRREIEDHAGVRPSHFDAPCFRVGGSRRPVDVTPCSLAIAGEAVHPPIAGRLITSARNTFSEQP